MSIFKKRSPEAVKCSVCRDWLEPPPSKESDRLKLGDRVRTCYKCQTCGEWKCASCGRQLLAGCRSCGGHSFAQQQMVIG
jgi:hypothetical protein